ncbi:hypothetical protein [Pseudarthrobacter sp. J64]|uniref:hypothetical protein n=1 Tax=Pseudarthrobacter sp. J64 TaxID=3116485 RepID=UPI002E81FB6B|nr:hypothetical protein [Pseudarthrobacter sp. J64]
MEDQDLAEIANQLYALPFDEFIAARTAAAKDAGKEQAAGVRTLPKPSAAAWTVNMLVRSRPDVLEDLEDLGGRMRQAQEKFDAGALRELGRERRAALASAVDAARDVSTELGRPLSTAIATEVEATLRALTADEGAAAAVRTGRLLRSLSADGVDQVSLDGAVAVPGAMDVPAPKAPSLPRKAPAREASASETAGPEAPTSEAAEPKKKPSKERSRDQTEAKSTKPRLVAVQPKERPATPSLLEKAKARAEEARQEADEAAREAEDRETEAAELAEETAHLASEAKRLREELKAVEDRLDRARKQEATAAAEARRLRRAADKSLRSADLAHERVLRLGNTRN